MNYFQDEFNAEYNRHRIQDEIKQIRLEQLALKSRPYKPSRFERTMFSFANVMRSHQSLAITPRPRASHIRNIFGYRS